MRVCIGCGVEKPASEFDKQSDGRSLTRCRTCRSARQRDRRAQMLQEVAGLLSEKECWRCKLTLPIDDFDWKANHALGRRAACRACEDPNGTKRCRYCGEIKPKSEFHQHAGSGHGGHRQGDCKDCQKVFMRRYRLARHYGMTEEDYTRRFDAQGGVCALCDNPPEEDGVLRVDHDHSCCPGEKTCGRCIRGLLCDRCNRGLGYFRDNPSALVKAVDYVKLGGVA